MNRIHSKLRKLTSLLLAVLMSVSLYAPVQIHADGAVAAINDITYDSLDKAISNASNGDEIILLTDVTCTTKPSLSQGITLNLNQNTLTLSGLYGGIDLRHESASIINGTINYTKENAAVKVWKADRIENVVINCTATPSDKVIGGIVLQESSESRINLIKDVTINGATNGIETYRCGNAAQDVIGSMENVTIDAVETGLLLSAPVGTATNCIIHGGETGIIMHRKGTYSVTLDLEDSTVSGKTAIFVHDETGYTGNTGTIELKVNSQSQLEGNPILQTNYSSTEGEGEITVNIETLKNSECILDENGVKSYFEAHSYGTVYFDENTHVTRCGNCHVLQETADHSYKELAEEYVAPSCEQPGKKVEECDGCKDRKEIVLPANNHDECSHVAVIGTESYDTLTDAVTIANSDNAKITLLKNVELGGKLIITGNVIIEGEFTITRAKSYTGTLFEVQTGASLTLDGGLTIDGGNKYEFDQSSYNADLADWENAVPKEESTKWFTPEEGAPVADAYMMTVSGENSAIHLNKVSITNHYSTNGSGLVSAGKGAKVILTGAQITHCASTNGSGLVVNASAGVWSREDKLITVEMNEGTVIDGNHVGGNHGIFKIYMGTFFTMNGGEVKNTTGWNSNGTVIGIYHADVTMNGGLICSNSSVYGPDNGRNAAVYGHSNHSFVMNGGTICHNTGRSKAGVDSPYAEEGYTGNTIINNGTIIDNTVIGTWTQPDVSGGKTLTINGGTFTQDVSQWLSPTADIIKNDDGTWTVVRDTTPPEVVNFKQTYETEKGPRVKAVITFNEPVTITNGDWKEASDDRTSYYMHFYRTKDVSVNYQDEAGNLATYAFTVDMVAPEVVSVEQIYEEKENGRIKVTVTFSEPVKDVTSGSTTWRANVDQTVYTTFVYKTKNLEVTFTDMAEITGSYNFDVDKTAPTIVFSNTSGEPVAERTVTMTASEAIQAPEGWTEVEGSNGTQWTRAFTSNTKMNIVVKDLVGNPSTTTLLDVKNVDSTVPTAVVSYSITVPTQENITVTLKTNTDCETPAGWTKVNWREFTKVYTDNGSESFKLTSRTGVSGDTDVVVEVSNIDRIAPSFEFSNTSGSIVASRTVTLTASEAIQTPEGWTEVEGSNGTQWTKTFTKNTKIKNFTVVDLAGNVSDSKTLDVKNVDSTVPVGTVTYSTVDFTNTDVVVTLKTNTDCETPAGWTKVNWREFTKVYTDNGSESFKLTSRTGVSGVADVVVEVSNIDKLAPTLTYYVYGSQVRVFADEEVTLNASGWTKKNNGKEWRKSLSAGKEYTLTATDKAGNVSAELVIDRILPVITVNSSSTGSEGYFSNLLLDFADNAALKAVVINGTSYDHTELTYVDNSRYTEGENTVIAVDINGNKSDAFTFIYDTTAPVLSYSVHSSQVRLYANESVTLDVRHWTSKNEGKEWRKTLESGVDYVVVATDKAGNNSTITIDRILPVASITTSNDNGNSYTNRPVTATLTASESLREIEGWNKVDNVTFTKEFSDNGEYNVEIIDENGNKNTVSFEIKGIDRTAPGVDVSYSTTEETEDSVTVTLSIVDETAVVLNQEGWVAPTLMQAEFQKTYFENTREEVSVIDSAGNITHVTIVISNIIKKVDPVPTPNVTPSQPSQSISEPEIPNTSDSSNLMNWSMVAMSTLLAAIVLTLFKKRQFSKQ